MLAEMLTTELIKLSNTNGSTIKSVVLPFEKNSNKNYHINYNLI